MTDPWFKPKTHGYGAYPLNWKGWALTVGYGVAIMPFSLLMLWPEESGGVDWLRVALWLVLLTLITAGFVWLCKIKTDGPWRWRWGEKN